MLPPIRRRGFLGAATAFGAGVPFATIAVRGAEAPSNRVTVGVMGLSRGRALADVFAKTPGVVVKYACDVDSKRAAAGAETVEKASKDGKAQAIGDFRKILDDPEVDALVCAAPNFWHAPATILAAKAGKHTYVEKPCSHTPEEGELMVEAARKHKRCVQMGTQRRSTAAIREAIERLHKGEIGRVYMARSWYAADRGSIGKGKPAEVPEYIDYELWQGPVPRRPYVDNLVHYNWHWRWHWGNGELGNNGVHALDLCRWGLGVDYPVRVTSAGGRYVFDDDQETPDTHSVTFEFPNESMMSWEGLSCNARQEGFVTFYGEKGSLAIDDGGSYSIFDMKNKRIEQVKGGGGESEHIANFVDAIRSDNPQLLNQEIAEGHKSTLVCHLGNIAQRVGRTIRCDESNGHILDDAEAAALWSKAYEKGWEPTV